MKSFWNVLALLIAAILIGHIGKSAAQFGGPMGGMGGGPPGDGLDGRPRGSIMASGSHLIASTEQQLDNLRFQLKLHPEQESAWLSYQEKVGALVADQLRPEPTAVAEAGNAVRQVDRKADVVRNRLAAIEDIGDAARHLYDLLDEQQRAVADRLLAATVPSVYSGASADRSSAFCAPGGRADRNGGRDGQRPPD
jgi:hypothetical protein